MRGLRSLCLAVLLFGAAACAETSVESLDTTVAGSAPVNDGSSAATTPTGDFGSRYVGTPVAFWFWAPY